MNVTIFLIAALLTIAFVAVISSKQFGRWRYYLGLKKSLARNWDGLKLQKNDGLLEVACQACPKYSSLTSRCTVPFGTPLRKCIHASGELHFRQMAGKLALEIGCGQESHTKTVIETVGGHWIGLDPRPGKEGRHSIRSVGGLGQQLPFRDECFDVVFGIQTIEHWGETASTYGRGDYHGEVLEEAWRVLKPGGWIYFDAPIHLHGTAEFIRGDMDSIRRLFQHQNWHNLQMMSWRHLYEPLRPRIAPPVDYDQWPRLMPDSSLEEREQLRRKSAWVLAIRAEKPV